MQTIPRYDGYIFDLDGTIYLGDILLPGAAELLHTLRREGVGSHFSRTIRRRHVVSMPSGCSAWALLPMSTRL